MEEMKRRFPSLPLSGEEKGKIYSLIMDFSEDELDKLFPAFLDDTAVAALLKSKCLSQPVAFPAVAGEIGPVFKFNLPRPSQMNAGETFTFCEEVFSKTRPIYVREPWGRFYSKMREMEKSLGRAVIHVSGNPGIGKSTFLCYVLVRLLMEDKERVYVELVQQDVVERYTFFPNGTYQKFLHAFGNSPDKKFILTDQRFVGSRGHATYIFASSKKSNWVEAKKVSDESRFLHMYMPPWSEEELKHIFYRYDFLDERKFSDPQTEFLVRFLLFGSIPRLYFIPQVSLSVAYDEVQKNIASMIKEGVIDANIFKGFGDNGEEVFVMWPQEDFLGIESITPVSEWVSRCIVEAATHKKVNGFEEFILKAEKDSTLRSTAGNLFERYAHERLSMGGTFSAVEDGSKVVLKTRQKKYFSGVAVSGDPDWKPDSDLYWIPRNKNFTIIDSLDSEHMFQISLAKKRRPMDRAVFRTLQSDLNKDAYMVLVKLEGDTREAPDMKVAEKERKLMSGADKKLVFANLEYGRLQKLCKEYGIRANMRKDEMVQELEALSKLKDDVSDGEPEPKSPVVKTIVLRSDFSADCAAKSTPPSFDEVMFYVKNDMHYGRSVRDTDYGKLEGDDVEATEMDVDSEQAFDVSLEVGSTSGFQSDYVYRTELKDGVLKLDLAHLRGTLKDKRITVMVDVPVKESQCGFLSAL